MHILAFEDQPTEFAGGQERSLFEALRFFAEKGVQVSLCYRKDGSLLPRYRDFLHELFCIRSRVFQKPFAPFLRDLALLVRKARKSSWDVLYANQYFDTPFVASLGVLTGIPVVCHLRLASPSYLSRQYRWGLHRCDRLIATSAHTKQSYVNEGFDSTKITIINNGVDCELFAPRALPDYRKELRITYLGRFCPGKGLEVLLEAFTLRKSGSPALQLHLAGNPHGPDSGPRYLAALKKQAGEELNCTIFFHEHVADIRHFLDQSDLVVLPSTCQEAFGRILIEAMASGVPVLATRVGGVPEVLLPRFPAHLVEPGNAPALLAKIEELVTWRSTQPNLGDSSREWVLRRFSSDERLGELLAKMGHLASSARQQGAIDRIRMAFS